MIHFPGRWLIWLEETSQLLNVESNSTANRVKIELSDMEFRIHTALFAIRKLEESRGDRMNLGNFNVELSSWPVTEAKIAEVRRSLSPDLETWYDLSKSQRNSVSYKRVIDLFVHARICNFSFNSHFDSFLDDIGIFVASDYTMKDQIVRVPLRVIDQIVKHGISVLGTKVRKPTATVQMDNSDSSGSAAASR